MLKLRFIDAGATERRRKGQQGKTKRESPKRFPEGFPKTSVSVNHDEEDEESERGASTGARRSPVRVRRCAGRRSAS